MDSSRVEDSQDVFLIKNEEGGRKIVGNNNNYEWIFVIMFMQ